MPFKHAFYHETDFRPVQGHLVYGPHIILPVGHFKAVFNLHLTGFTPSLTRKSITLDIARDGSEIVAMRRLRLHERLLNQPNGISIAFKNEDVTARYEFRIYIQGTPPFTRLRFGGVRLDQVEATSSSRLRRAELHIGEQLSLLVQLVADRTRALYEIPSPTEIGVYPAAAALRTREIAIAPFSNKELRDWPLAHYVALIRLLVDRLDCTVTLLGSREQVEKLGLLALEVGNSTQVRNFGGQTAWRDLPTLLRQSDLVICNNSGIAHAAAASGALTLAIYSASHPPPEWGPRGQRSHAVMSVVPCSPCGFDRLVECPHDYRCMRSLAPETVFEEAVKLLSG
jgi:hypothetical protein